MVNDSNVFGFGFFLTAISIALLLNALGSKKKTSAAAAPIHQQSDRADHARVAALEQQCLHLNEELRVLHQQCSRLRQELQQQKTQIKADVQDEVFECLQTLLVTYPTANQLAQVNSDLSAKTILSLFASLTNLLQEWSVEPIGSVWGQVPYNAQLHQPDSDDVAEGELVYIRYVGYREGDRILCPATVSRTLPAGAQPQP